MTTDLATVLREQGATGLMQRGRELEVPAVECARHGRREYEAECQLCRLEHKRAQDTLRRYLAGAGCPERFAGARLADYTVEGEGQRRAVDAVRDVLAGRSIMALLGGRTGTGKTMLGVAAAHEWVDAMLAAGDGRGPAVYTTARALVDSLKATWARGSERTESQEVRRYTAAGLLVLDELGDGRGKDEEVYQLSHVINARYEHQRPTIIITNGAMATLREARVVDDRALSRLRAADVRRAECDWDDERARGGQDRAAGE